MSWVWLALLGCSYIGDEEHQSRIDQDGDGLVAIEYEGGTDCDDGDADVGVAATWYADSDEDGYGTGASVESCTQPSGYAALPGDCDDGDDAIHPAADEICDGIDNDCDELTDDADDDVTDPVTWYLDNDGDDYGNDAQTTAACEAPFGYVADGGDCEDADGDVHPDADEVCDDADQDCDDVVDEDPTDSTVWYADADADGFGDSSTAESFCDDPGSGYVLEGGDCDDDEPDANPDATEVCDGIDNDCDEVTDPDGLSDGTWVYPDGDGDGYGEDSGAERVCEVPTGYATEDEDCDDSDADIHPGADETCDDVDQDCDDDVDEDPTDGTEYFADSDGDGYGDEDDSVEACEAPSDYVDNDDDCDDSRGSVNPAATEKCNYRDDDCDGDTDESKAANVSRWYVDSDGDGYGDASTSVIQCWEPTGYCDNDDDCDDGDGNVNPDADEVCANSTDDDCDGDTDEECVGTNCFDDTGIITNLTYELNEGTIDTGDAYTGLKYYDDYEFEGYSGDELGIHLYSADFDAEVSIYDDTCTKLDSDNNSARGTNSFLEYTLTADGIYTVVVSTNQANKVGDYVLEVLDISVAVGDNCDSDSNDLDLITSSSDSLTSALTTGDAQFTSGEYYDDVEYFSFYGDRVVSTLSSTDFDAYLYLADPQCYIIDSDDDSGGGTSGTDSQVVFDTDRTGIYTLAPSTYYPAKTGIYTLGSQATW